jgi:hypothetical protein
MTRFLRLLPLFFLTACLPAYGEKTFWEVYGIETDEDTDRLYSYERFCHDGKDNDGDGEVDCADTYDCDYGSCVEGDSDSDTDI